MDATGVSGEIFNVGSTERVTINELAQRVLERDGLDVEDRRTSRTTRSTARGSRTCSTASRRSRRSTARSAGSRRVALDEILADVIAARRAPRRVLVER